MGIFKKSFGISAGILALTLVIGGGVGMAKWKRRQDRLCPKRTLCSLKDVSILEKLPVVSQDLPHLLAQPFFFMGEGKQCQVFESADRRFVIKFFKKSSRKKHCERLQESLQGAILARLEIPDETAIVSLVVREQSTQLPTITVLNKKGTVDHIVLQQTPFMVQRNAAPLKRTLVTLITEKKTTQAAACIQSIFTLLSKCRQKGILDRDGSLIRNGNVGIIDGKAVLLDTGKLCRSKDMQQQTLHDVNRLKPLGSWLQKSCPELVPVFKKYLKEYERVGRSHCILGGAQTQTG